MNKSRVIMVLASVIVFAGLGMGVLAYLSAPGAEAQASTLPDAAAWMPSSAQFVGYVDLDALLSSPLGEEWEAAALRARAFSEADEFREKTGLDPWNDFRALAVSSRRTDDEDEWGLALIGELDPDRIVSAIAEKEELQSSSYRDSTLYLVRESPERKEARALAFPSTSVALFGSPGYVRDMLDVGAGRRPSAVEGPLAGWLQQVPLSDTFWFIGSSEAGLDRLMAGQPRVPPLQSFAVAGNFGAEVSLIAKGKTSGPVAAQKLADVVRGFIALGSLRQDSPPELTALLESVQVAVLEDQVEVAAVVPYETLRRLAARKKEAEP